MAKRIIITGVSRGIGFRSARLLVYQGHEVLGISRDEEGLAQLKKDCRNMPGRLITAALDFTDTAAVTHEFKKHWKALDVLINNAAAFRKIPFGEVSMEQMAEIYRVNVFAPVELARRLSPDIKNGGHILNISSVGGVSGSEKFAGLLTYSSSKAALNIATECLAVELANKDIACNALALGSSSTEMFRKAFPGMEAASTPHEMAEYLVYFAIKGATLFNGRVIQVSRQSP